MKKTLVAFSTIAILLFGGLALPTITAQAEPSSLAEVQKERQKLKEKLNDKEKEIATVLEEIEALHNEIVELENGLKANKEALNETEDLIEEYNTQIDEIQNEIDVINVRIQERAEILKTRLSSYQENGNINYLEVLLGSKGFNDFLSRIEAVSKITAADTDLIEQQEADRAEVEKLQDEVIVKLEEQEDVKVELEGIKEVIEEQKEDVEKSKKKLDKQKDKLVKEKSKLTTEDSNLAALELTYMPVLRSTGSSSSSSSATGGSVMTNKPITAPTGGAVSAAMSRVGKNNVYVWAGKNPQTGFDCSGFVSWAYGNKIPSSTAALQSTGTKVSLSEAQPGDLIFFDTYKTNGHVGIYLGNGKWVGSQSSNGVQVETLSNTYWSKAFKGHVRRVN